MTVAFTCLLLAATPVETLNEVQSTYRKAGDLTARFTQVHWDVMRKTERKESGQLWAKQDGRVRWTYLDPIRKDFVYDGKAAYFYEPEEAEVTVFERFEDSPLWNALRFLWGQGAILDSFDVEACSKDCDVGDKGDIVLDMSPKVDLPTVKRSLLVVDPKKHTVKRSVVIDKLDNRMEYSFTEVTFHAEVPDKKFNFVVPKGVSIVRSTLTNEGQKKKKKK